ncbi:alpha/beta hydrolase [Achromobacter sp. GG226]|uniref:alpha/beta hydrolase n=1 Tax=Verticiella alkaliphila TaxID=2779529 RepID=UPI001C0D21CB|nr:alpha/beta family hydrolase [Verticiella sp. GG226]MBU4611007.1 alpha/beta hydrolase [Verticiella sp. GG226]
MSDTAAVFTATQVATLAGPVGRIEVRVDLPTAAPRGLAVVLHPQPLLGGSPRHPIPHRWAQGLCQDGWLVVRPSFRGVGGTEGTYDHGEGETEDMRIVCAQLVDAWPSLPLALFGFSFGAYVAARVAAGLAEAGTPAASLLLAGVPVGDVPAGRHYATPSVAPETLLLHGERDAEAPLANVLTWARPQGVPVTVLPGADHVFAGHHPWLLRQVIAHARQAQR